MLYGLLLIITITTISIANINNNFQTFQPYINVQNMWVDENNNSIDLSYIADDTVAYKYLNENELNKTLFFRAKNVNVRVYKNDTLYIDYSNLTPEEMAWYKTPGTYYVSGDTFARSEDTGKDEFFQFIIPKAKMLSDVTLTLEAEGDPSTFSMQMKVLRPKDGVMMKLVQYNMTE